MHPERRPNPDRSAESLEARLRALPQPPIPGGLEARLLAAIPLKRRSRRRWLVLVGVASALAAACLLAVFARPGRNGTNRVPGPPAEEIAEQGTPRLPDDSAGITAWSQTRRVLDGAEPPPFTWPLSETPPFTATSAPDDLLD
jgi:hypothetical protein